MYDRSVGEDCLEVDLLVDAICLWGDRKNTCATHSIRAQSIRFLVVKTLMTMRKMENMTTCEVVRMGLLFEKLKGKFIQRYRLRRRLRSRALTYLVVSFSEDQNNRRWKGSIPKRQ
jgi:DNA transposition AAA+ family ATPase